MSGTDKIAQAALEKHHVALSEWIKQIVTLSTALLAYLASIQQSEKFVENEVFFSLTILALLSLSVTVGAGIIVLRSQWRVPLEQAGKAFSLVARFGQPNADSVLSARGGISSAPSKFEGACRIVSFASFLASIVILLAMGIFNAHLRKEAATKQSIYPCPSIISMGPSAKK